MAEQKDWGVIAEFENPARLLEAATKLTNEGYKDVESWSPFPIHGMDDAMKLPCSKVPWFTLTGAICGMTLAAWLQVTALALPPLSKTLSLCLSDLASSSTRPEDVRQHRNDRSV